MEYKEVVGDLTVIYTGTPEEIAKLVRLTKEPQEITISTTKEAHHLADDILKRRPMFFN